MKIKVKKDSWRRYDNSIRIRILKKMGESGQFFETTQDLFYDKVRLKDNVEFGIGGGFTVSVNDIEKVTDDIRDGMFYCTNCGHIYCDEKCPSCGVFAESRVLMQNGVHEMKRRRFKISSSIFRQLKVSPGARF